ncbi:LPXTG cell wall anchor domain-containing protein [Streptomyces sp. NBC_00285]|uniref:LPXTG cell wall anchor domain-containing protein n=1 Tax=Streptomyces sp. NBC_00285 TaxID=2975700 RepID=UPI002E2D9416|nr:LPXTG cell wall anchor domain-containing protein [Streptomyces sp. NBC_00285]
MTSHHTAFGAALAAVLLVLASGATAVAVDPSPLPTKGRTTIEADKQLNVGSAAQTVHVVWGFSDPAVDLPAPADLTLVIDARGLAGIARVVVADPRCTAHGRVFSCANQDTSQPTNLDFTVQAKTGAALGATGTILYTASAGRGTHATARAKVIVGIPELVVGKVPAMTHVSPGSRIRLPLRLRNTGDLATDRRVVLRWESAGGLAFDRKFSNCGYSVGSDLVAPDGRTSVTCVFKAPVAAGATVELSSPLTATVGEHVMTSVTHYWVEFLKPGERPGTGPEPGTGPALTLVPASGAGDGFERGTQGQVGVSADNSADLAATATAKRAAGAGEWTLALDAVNHGPASVYGTDHESVAVVDVVLPKHTVATDYRHAESEDSVYGPCLLRNGDTGTAPFEAGHRRYVCTVPYGIAVGGSQEFGLSVKTDKDYDGAKGTVTVRPGPAGIPLHDPHTSNDTVTFTFGTQPATGTDHTALVTTAAIGAALLAGTILVLRRRRRSR